jgi:hypothetical protein
MTQLKQRLEYLLLHASSRDRCLPPWNGIVKSMSMSCLSLGFVVGQAEALNDGESYVSVHLLFK